MIIEPGWLETIQFLIRILLAVLCTNMIGLAFRKDAHPSPMYMLMLVGMGSALLKMTANQMYVELPFFADVAIIMFLILGISILSASALFSARDRDFGYKAGGALWIAGAVGIAAGTGYYVLVVVVSVFSYLILNKIQFPTEGNYKP